MSKPVLCGDCKYMPTDGDPCPKTGLALPDRDDTLSQCSFWKLGEYRVTIEVNNGVASVTCLAPLELALHPSRAAEAEIIDHDNERR